MIDTNELRKLCTSATPGPWTATNRSDWSECVAEISDWHVVPTLQQSELSNMDVDAAYIAAANPATVLALLDALVDAHRNMDDFGLLADKKTSECRSLIKWINDIAEDLSIPEDSVDGMSIGDAIFRLKQIEAAARNLAKVKGRHHSEQAMNQLLEALG